MQTHLSDAEVCAFASLKLYKYNNNNDIHIDNKNDYYFSFIFFTLWLLLSLLNFLVASNGSIVDVCCCSF